MTMGRYLQEAEEQCNKQAYQQNEMNFSGGNWYVWMSYLVENDVS